jgi:hypothetical protein
MLQLYSKIFLALIFSWFSYLPYVRIRESLKIKINLHGKDHSFNFGKRDFKSFEISDGNPEKALRSNFCL